MKKRSMHSQHQCQKGRKRESEKGKLLFEDPQLLIYSVAHDGFS